jgi:DNA repair protein RecN (Recombination protein N)
MRLARPVCLSFSADQYRFFIPGIIRKNYFWRGFTKKNSCAILRLVHAPQALSAGFLFMLRELSIKNFAIIDDLQIRFDAGLTIMSGETGAGKSIIIHAVQLLLGARATAKLIRTGEDTAELEAFFDLAPAAPVLAIMADQGYPGEEGLLVRRVISRQDRHRVFINGRMATMQILQTITENLASISSQHAHQSLLKEDYQLDILDRYGNLMDLREHIAELYRTIVPLLAQRDQLLAQRDHQDEQRELLQFQKGEIEAAQVSPEEDERLEKERRRLRNAQTLMQTVNHSLEVLYGAQDSVTDRLGGMQRQLEPAAAIDGDLQRPTERVAELIYQIEDLVEELRRYLRHVESDDHRLEEVDARLDTLNRLKRKYGPTLADVIGKHQSIEVALAGLENLAEQIGTLDARLQQNHQRLVKAVRNLHDQRVTVAETLSSDIAEQLSSLQMPGTRFAVALTPVPADEHTPAFLTVDGCKTDARGADRAVFQIAPNVGEQLKPLAAIASGGELSRVVLALKAILAAGSALETVIFDEVDAGIGGGVAETVGQKLGALAAHHQVICITHLPQIAKFGDSHLKISKSVHRGRTRTTIDPLDTEERLREMARMLGGIKITPKTLAHAREMLMGK